MNKVPKYILGLIRNFLIGIEQISAHQLQQIETILNGGDPPPLLLRQKELARELSVCRQTVKAWEEKGLIRPIVLPDGQKRYKISDIIKEYK